MDSDICTVCDGTRWDVCGVCGGGGGAYVGEDWQMCPHCFGGRVACERCQGKERPARKRMQRRHKPPMQSA